MYFLGWRRNSRPSAKKWKTLLKISEKNTTATSFQSQPGSAVSAGNMVL